MSGSGTIAPAPWFTGLLDSGAPNAGGYLLTYHAGTDDPLPIWTDIDLTIESDGVLDDAGRISFYVSENSYKYKMFDVDDNLIRTQDNVPSTQVGQSGGLGEIFSFDGAPDAPFVNTTYTSGATFAALHAGTSIYNVNSVNLTGTYAIQVMGLATGGGTITVAIVNLDDGSPDTPLATATVTSSVGARAISGLITFAAAGTAKNYGIKVKVSAGSGLVWSVKLVRVS